MQRLKQLIRTCGACATMLFFTVAFVFAIFVATPYNVYALANNEVTFTPRYNPDPSGSGATGSTAFLQFSLTNNGPQSYDAMWLLYDTSKLTWGLHCEVSNTGYSGYAGCHDSFKSGETAGTGTFINHGNNTWILAPGETQYYRINITNDGGATPYKNVPITIKMGVSTYANRNTSTKYDVVNGNHVYAYEAPAIPAPPVLSGTAQPNQNALTWTTSSGATVYKLYNGVNLIYSGSNTDYTHTGLTNGQAYSYTVKAGNSGGDSASSNEVTLTPPLPPGAPTLSVTDKTHNSINLSWTNPDGTTIFRLYRNGQEIYSGTAVTYNDTGLSTGLTYEYKVKAENVSGSNDSNIVTAQTVPDDMPITMEQANMLSLGLAGYLSWLSVKPFRFRSE